MNGLKDLKKGLKGLDIRGRMFVQKCGQQYLNELDPNHNKMTD